MATPKERFVAALEAENGHCLWQIALEKVEGRPRVFIEGWATFAGIVLLQWWDDERGSATLFLEATNSIRVDDSLKALWDRSREVRAGASKKRS